MEAQTYSVFQAIGSRKAREGLDLLLALLEKPGAVEEIADRTGLSSGTASRRLDDLALAGLLARPRPRDPYSVAHEEETRRFLEAAGALSTAILRAREAGEAQLGRRIRRTRVRPADEAASDKTNPS